MTRLKSFPSTPFFLTVSKSTEEDDELRTGDGKNVVDVIIHNHRHLLIKTTIVRILGPSVVENHREGCCRILPQYFHFNVRQWAFLGHLILGWQQQ